MNYKDYCKKKERWLKCYEKIPELGNAVVAFDELQEHIQDATKLIDAARNAYSALDNHIEYEKGVSPLCDVIVGSLNVADRFLELEEELEDIRALLRKMQYKYDEEFGNDN